MPKSLREAAAEAIREYDAWVQDVESVIGRQPKTTFMDNLRAALDAPDGWISVEERLPVEGVRVLVWQRGFHRFARRQRSGMGDPGWIAEGGDWRHELSSGITHWMPLPEPPKSREGAE